MCLTYIYFVSHFCQCLCQLNLPQNVFQVHCQEGELVIFYTAAKNAHLAKIISPEIKLSTEEFFYSIKRGVILTFYTFCSNKKPEAKPRAFYSQNV